MTMENMDAEMGGTSQEQIYFDGLLVDYIKTMNETLEALARAPVDQLPKAIGWDQVVSMCEKLCSEATMVGALWTGGPSEVQSLTENLRSFFSLLQGLILLAYGASVGAGRTLTLCIQTSVKQVVDVSVELMKEAVLSYDSPEEREEEAIPKAIAKVWKSFEAVKKTPSKNVTAIGKAVTQVSISIKHNLHKMQELKEDVNKGYVEAQRSKKELVGVTCDPTSDVKEASGDEGGSTKEVKDKVSGEAGSSKHENDVLSPEDIRIVGLIIDVTSGIDGMMNKLIRAIMGLLRKEMEGTLDDSVGCLEKILELSEQIESQIEELHSCIIHQQEFSAIKLALVKISNAVCVIMMITHQIGGSSRDFIQACTNSRSLIRKLGSEVFGPLSAAELLLHGQDQPGV